MPTLTLIGHYNGITCRFFKLAGLCCEISRQFTENVVFLYCINFDSFNGSYY